MGRLVAIAVAAVLLAGCGGNGKKHAAACAPRPVSHYVIYRARGRPGTPVTPASLGATVKALCGRARAAGVTDLVVQRVGASEIKLGGAKPPPASLGASARLAFYDWEPNLLPPNQTRPTLSLYKAVQVASKQKPRGHGHHTYGTRYYVFGPGRKPLGGGTNAADGYYGSCREIAAAFHGKSACGASRGSIVVTVPRGVVVLKDESPPPAKAGVGYWILQDDAELTGADIRNPKQQFDPQTNQPIVSFGFTDKGRRAFARVTRREALRGARIPVPPGGDPQQTFQTFGIALDNQLVSRATIDYRANPKGISGSTGAQINGLGDIAQTQELARNLAARPLPLDLVVVRTR